MNVYFVLFLANVDVMKNIFMYVCGYERIRILMMFEKAKNKENKNLNKVGDRGWMPIKREHATQDVKQLKCKEMT